MDDVWSVGSEVEGKNPEQPEAEVKVGKRIAVTNLDWDSIGALDLLSLFTSLCNGKPKMSIEKV